MLNMKNLFLLFFSFIMIISCNIKYEDSKNCYDESFAYFSNNNVTTVEELDCEEQKIVKEQINKALKENEFVSNSRNENQYYKQCVVSYNKKGEKIIWVNCIRKNIGHENEWKKGILEMLDGGDNYFNLKINIRTKKYYEMYVNGFA